MSKRPSILGNLDLEPEPSSAPTPERTTSKVVKMEAPQRTPAPASDLVRSSIYLSKAAHRRLKEIGLVEDKKVHDLIMEGIDAVIAKRGHNESARRKPRT
jgi:hypothetical protein